MKAGIVAYGAEVPVLRIKVEEIARAWKKDGANIAAGLGVKEKAVASFDEDSCTLAVGAARKAIDNFEIEAQKIGAIYVGSESHPYAVKPTASIVADAIEAGPELMAADLEFACKAGTAGVQMCLGFAESKMIEYGLSIGTDTAQGRPNDALEFTAGSGAGAIVVGGNEKEIIARCEATYSFTTDTPDFWRRPKEDFPMHAGRFTGEPAYFKHVLSASRAIMEKTGYKPKDFDYVVFHQPNAKFPLKAGKILGFEPEKFKEGLLVPEIGNTYSGATMIGLCSVLDVAKPGERILATSYGSGAGSDAFVFETTENISKKRAKLPVKEMIKEKEYIDYAEYLKHRKKMKSL